MSILKRLQERRQQRGMMRRLSDRAMRCQNCAWFQPLREEEAHALLGQLRAEVAGREAVARLTTSPGQLPPGSVLRGKQDPRLDAAVGILGAAGLAGRCGHPAAGTPPPEWGATKPWGGRNQLVNMAFVCSRWSNPHVKPDGGAAETELPGEATERLDPTRAEVPAGLDGLALSRAVAGSSGAPSASEPGPGPGPEPERCKEEN